MAYGSVSRASKICCEVNERESRLLKEINPGIGVMFLVINGIDLAQVDNIDRSINIRD